MKGLLVTLEGQDGSGKSTLLDIISTQLEQENLSVLVVPEFSSRVVGRLLQETLTQNKFLRLNDFGVSALTETLYVLADLYSQDEFEIRSALQQGAVVVKERHVDSIFACQLPKIVNDYPMSDEEQVFQWLRHMCSQLTEPDLTVFLSVSDEELGRRIKMRGEQVSADDFTVFRERQVIYDRVATEDQHRWLEVINDGNPQITAQIVLREITQRLGL